VSLSFLALGEDKVLWQIGQNDNNTAEFALGPDRSNQYSVTFPHGALFVAGQSDAKQDWPYIQPGPADVWAGGKSHTFRILFGLSNAPGEGECELVLDFVDTHSTQPPKLASKSENVSLTTINVVLGMVAICGLYLSPMYLVGHWYAKSLIWLGTALAAVAALALTWYPNLPAARLPTEDE
jgi:hypothetical protein